MGGGRRSTVLALRAGPQVVWSFYLCMVRRYRSKDRSTINYPHLLHKGCTARPGLVRVEAVRLVDKEDLADGLVHHPFRLDSGLADVAVRTNSVVL